ncbi:hypothetical protein GS882_03275 [Rhodococcus hoagii]|uniref:Depolymerase 2 capsule K5-specific C-terminal domain-containing protein n=1 Tax=Rhodococcus hoagii TaxID=43767 RepID=A0A9Q4ZIH4_RHOHA|nr:hypothetical protein [Prescottella equi]NKT77243.1 hypothetical protein [Prescottella equi]
MPYNKFHDDWKNDPDPSTPITAEAVEHIEDGVQRAHRTLDGQLRSMVVATAEDFPGLDPTGVADSSAAFQAAVNATPDGARLIVPAGVYKLDAGVAVTDRTVTIESYGVTYTKSTDGAIFSAAATVDTVYAVSVLSAVTVADENSAPGQRLTVAGETGWLRGDIVQLVSDDVIPGGLPGSGTAEYRCGQHFMVHSAAPGSVDLLGALHDPMSTNIRVHRMRGHRVAFRGGRFTKTGGGVTVAFTRLVAPEFSDATIHTTGGQAVSFAGCVGWRANNVVVENAPNVPASGIFGYGIMNMSSSWGRADRLRVHRVRHAYTNDNTALSAGSNQFHLYGRPFGNVVSNSTAIGTDNSAWDTHSGSQAEQFVNCDAIDCYNVYGLRGRGHSVRGGKAVDCQHLLNIFSQTGSNSESWGHIVDGVHATRITSGNHAIRVDLNPISGILETRKSMIRNVTIDGAAAHTFVVNNGTLEVDGIMVTAAPTQISNAAVFQLDNANVTGTNVSMDHLQNTAGTGIRFVYVKGATQFTLRRGRWDFTSGNSRMTRIVVRAAGAADTVKISDLSMLNKTTAPYDTITSASFVDWSAGFELSSVVMASQASIEDVAKLATIANTRAEVVKLQLYSNTSPYTLAALPAGMFRGQMLVMFTLATTNQPITIPNDPAKKILTATGSDVVLTGTSRPISFLWNGANWTQA